MVTVQHSPSLISLMVPVDVKCHLYVLRFLLLVLRTNIIMSNSSIYTGASADNYEILYSHAQYMIIIYQRSVYVRPQRPSYTRSTIKILVLPSM